MTHEKLDKAKAAYCESLGLHPTDESGYINCLIREAFEAGWQERKKAAFELAYAGMNAPNMVHAMDQRMREAAHAEGLREVDNL